MEKSPKDISRVAGVIAVITTLILFLTRSRELELNINYLSQRIFPFLGYSLPEFKTSRVRLKTRKLQDSDSSSGLHDVMYEHYSTNPLNHHTHGAHHHKKAWMTLEEVDGLKNEDVIMVLSSTTIKAYLQSRIIPSSRTWMRYFANVIVVIEDNFHARYDMRHCRMTEYAEYTTFDCHNEPTYLMSRNCDNRYYGAAGPCCKVDDALNFISNVRTELFSHTKFILHGDDDMYWRPDQVLRWLAAVDKSGINHLPIIANVRPSSPTPSQGGIWHIQECKEIRSAGWYQPLMLNHAALERMRAGSAAYGLTDTCNTFVVTHDVGVGPYAWMYQLYHIQMPGVEINGNHKGIAAARPNEMALHFVKHGKNDFCESGKDWGEMRYNQSVVLGCGDFGVAVPTKGALADMHEVWEYSREHHDNIVLGVDGQAGFKRQDVIINTRVDPTTGQEEEFIQHVLAGPPALQPMKPGDVRQTVGWEEYTFTEGTRHEVRVLPVLERLQGYENSEHAKMYDITKEWVKFNLTHCDPPGYIK